MREAEPTRLLFDLDGVVVDLDLSLDSPFLNSPPLPGAIETLKQLHHLGLYDVHFLSTAPWSQPDAWAHKRRWVERHLGDWGTRRLTLTHEKQRFQGDLLIDDRTENGAGLHPAHLQFGQPACPNWKALADLLLPGAIAICRGQWAAPSIQHGMHRLVEDAIRDDQLQHIPEDISAQILQFQSTATRPPERHFRSPIAGPDDVWRALPHEWNHLNAARLQSCAAQLGKPLETCDAERPWFDALLVSQAIDFLSKTCPDYTPEDGIGRLELTARKNRKRPHVSPLLPPHSDQSWYIHVDGHSIHTFQSRGPQEMASKTGRTYVKTSPVAWHLTETWARYHA